MKAQSLPPIEWKEQAAFWQKKGVQAFTIDAQNQKWIGTENGLYRVDNQGNTEEILLALSTAAPPISLGTVTALALDKAQNVWLGKCETEPKIWCKKNNDIWESFNIELENEFSHKKCLIKKIVIDGQNRKWFLTDGAGLILLEEEKGVEKLKYYNKKNTLLKSNEINDLLVTAGGLVWIATDNGLFQLYQDRFLELMQWQKHRVHALTLDKKGDLWISTTHHNTHFLYQNFKKIEKTNDITCQYFQLLATDKGLWAVGKALYFFPCSVSSKLKIFKSKNKKEIIPTPTENALSLQIDLKGHHWLASADKGLFSDIAPASNFSFLEKEDLSKIEISSTFIFDRSRILKNKEEFTLDILFSKNSNELLEQSYTELYKLLNLLKNHKELRLQIQGHTSATVAEGNPEFNVRLSKQRAQAVKAFLCEQGIAPERLETVGFGDTKPLDLRNPARNRRVSILIID